MKDRSFPAVTAAELRVLEELWRREEAAIRELRDALYPQGGSSKFATVQKLLARLADKGLVQRRNQEGAWLFRPRVGREELIGQELRRVAGRLSDNALAPLLTFLVEAGELTSRERAHLRKLLDEQPGGKQRP